jgi:hypothetical protein
MNNCDEVFDVYGVDNLSTNSNKPQYVIRKKPDTSIISIVAGKDVANRVADSINDYTQNIQQYEPYTNLLESCKFIPQMKAFESFGFTTKVSQVLAWSFNTHYNSKPYFPFNRSKDNTNIVVSITSPKGQPGIADVKVTPPNLKYDYTNRNKQLPNILFAIIHLHDKNNTPSIKQGVAQYAKSVSGGHSVLLILDRVCNNKFYLIDTLVWSLAERRKSIQNEVFLKIHEIFVNQGILPHNSTFTYEILTHPFQNYTEAVLKSDTKCFNNLLLNRDRKMAQGLGMTPLKTFVGHCGVLAFLFADISLRLYTMEPDLFMDCKRSPIHVLFMMLYNSDKGGLSKLYMFLIAKRFVTLSRNMRVQADKATHNQFKNPKPSTNSEDNGCESCNFIVKKKL